jgi:homoserine kinase type II
MAILTPLDHAEIARATEEFGVDARASCGVLAGSVNTNFEVTDERGGRWFLRLYEEQGHAAAEREARLLEHLATQGIPTPAPRPVAGGGRFVTTIRGKAAALFPFVAGTIRCQASVREADAFAVGAALAQIHRAGERDVATIAPLVPPESRFDLPALRARLEALRPQALAPDVRAARRLLIDRNHEIARGAFEAEPLPLVHGDVFRDNVLFGPDALVAVLDFESASRGSAAFDLAVTWLAWCFGDTLDLACSSALGAGYRSVRSIPRDERADLRRASELACVRFATTRITDYELRPAGVGRYKDFRRWLARAECVEALGDDGIARALGF